ncbi:MAG: tRNA (N6-isopentenyl adenosine(37)-C2)-methylthiotransferase MiaB [Chthonomonadales bacterium]
MPTTGGYHIITWGCQMNDEDSEQMALYLEGMGLHEVADPAQAEVVLLNTCSVRQKPVDKVYSKLGLLREMKLERPEMIVGVCGCMAQTESELIKKRAPFVDMVVGTGNIAAIPNLVEASRRRSNREMFKKGAGLTSLDLPERKGAIVTDIPLRNVMRKPKLKAHVPIMYGCDKFCAFCIVPNTRGRERSRSTADILSEIHAMAQQGTREITLLGQTVNSYGKNMAEGRVPFATLLEQINAVPGLRRIRFTSPYPKDFTDDLIEAVASLPKVCEHIHLPIQVADDELLGRMRRGYDMAQYHSIVEKLRAAIPGVAITTDVMLGFPGETEAQVQRTLDYVEATRFDAAFMFAYSVRTGTRAATMEDQIPHATKIERLERLIAIQNQISIEINNSLVGKVVEVLVERFNQRENNRLGGHTRGLKMVNFSVDPEGTRSPESLIGKLVPVRITEANLTGLIGEIAEEETPVLA